MRRYFNVILLSTALVLPIAMRADEHGNDKRYYDRSHKDYHEWNSNEDQRYREYLNEHHKEYHDFAKAKRREQEDYWKWRHEHQDNDRR